MMSDVQFPAEWAGKSVVLMALPASDTDWAPILPRAIECYRNMIDAIAPHATVVVLVRSAAEGREILREQIERNPDRVVTVEAPYNDTWTRDYGPISVTTADGSPVLLDFTFNAWGMKFAACHDNCVNRFLSELRLFTAPLIGRKNMVLEGGSIDTDGNGLLLTTSECLLSANRNPWMTKEEIEQRLKDYLGIKKVLWLDHGYLAGDDTDSHVDTLARFAPGRQIVYAHCTDPTDEHFTELEAMRRQIMEFTDLDGNLFNTVGLPMPEPIYDVDGNRLPATYANFLVLDSAVIMPTYGQPRPDELARQILEMTYERPVVTVDCRALVEQHGSLHCSTMQIPINATAL